MKITVLLTLLGALLSTARGDDSSCLTEAQFDTILHRWISIFNTADENVAKEIATPDLTFWSDSADFLFGVGPGSRTGVPTFANRSELIQGLQESQTLTRKVSRYNRFHAARYTNGDREASYGCDSITYHWRFDGKSKGNIPGSTNKKGAHVGSGGIHYLLIDNSVKKIRRVYEEFNIGEQLYTSGDFVCFQKHNESACPSFS